MAGAPTPTLLAPTTPSESCLLYLSLSHVPRYARIDPAQEIARIRNSLSLVEAYIYPHQRASFRRAADTVSTMPAKKELLDSDSKSSSPTVIGTQTAGGFYAGPTSAATHIEMVCSASLWPPHPHLILPKGP